MSVDPSTRAKLPRCGLARHLAAIAYDSVIVTGLLLIAAAVASPFDLGNQQAFRDPFFTLYLFAIWFFYLALCWKHGSMTVGMRAWNVVLMADKGGPPGWNTCFVRFATSLFSAAIFGLGFIWSVFDRHQRSWHDMASRSGLYRAAKKRGETRASH